MFKSNIIITEMLVQTQVLKSGPMAAVHRTSSTGACVSAGRACPENTGIAEPLGSPPTKPINKA